MDSIYNNSLNIRHEIIIVDNQSTDNTRQIITDNYKEVRLITPATNLGFAKANNIAAREAQGDYLLLLNPDTQIIGKTMEKMLAYYHEYAEPLGMLGPKILNPDGSIQQTYHRLPSIANRWAHAFFVDRLIPNEILSDYAGFDDGLCQKVDWLSGACLLIKKDIFKRAGGFDERFFLFYEDMDICARLLKLGYDNVYLPEASIVHAEGHCCQQKSVQRAKYEQTSRNIFLKKYYSGFALFIMKCLDVIYGINRICAILLTQLFRTENKITQIGYYKAMIATVFKSEVPREDGV